MVRSVFFLCIKSDRFEEFLWNIDVTSVETGECYIGPIDEHAV